MGRAVTVQDTAAVDPAGGAFDAEVCVIGAGAADYPPHTLMATYFQSFAEDNRLIERITFRTEVTRVEPVDGEGARAATAGPSRSPAGSGARTAP